MSFSTDRPATPSVRIPAGRFEASPFRSCYPAGDMLNGVYAGRFYASSDGQDPTPAYWALRRAAVLYDVPERPVEISGPNAEAFLERVLSRRIATLAEGRGRYAIALTHKGGIFTDGVLFRLGPERFWYVQPDAALDTWLLALSDGFDVVISDPKSRVLQIQGPASPAILADATGGGIGEELKYFHAGFFTIGGQEVYVSRTGWTGELGYEVYTQGDATDCPKLWDALLEAGTPHGMIFAPLASMGIRRIEAGILDNGSDITEAMTPFAAGLEDFIDLDKPGFIGRTALLGADRGRRLWGLRCRDAAPSRDCVVLLDGAQVGRVTTGAWSPYLNCGVGYVAFEKSANWLGMVLTSRFPDGVEHTADAVSLPFYDPEKRIPRGLDPRLP